MGPPDHCSKIITSDMSPSTANKKPNIGQRKIVSGRPSLMIKIAITAIVSGDIKLC